MANHGHPSEDVQDEVLLDPLERLSHKLKHWNLRQPQAEDVVALGKPRVEQARLEAVSRRSHRRFGAERISRESFSGMLSAFMPVQLEGVPLPKYRYGSAGSTYPVQVYLYVKDGKVEGVRGGNYYYHPQEHELVRFASEASLDRRLYEANQSIFNGASFAMFLVAEMKAITPLYGEWSRDFCMLEAGLMCQLLETWGPTQGIGLCQIGCLNFDSLREQFELDASHVYLHSLLGGPIGPEYSTQQALIDDSEDVRMMLELLE